MAAETELYDQLTSRLNSATAGKDILLSLWNATGDKLLALAGQQGLTINRDKDTVEVTSKDTQGGWKEYLGGFKEWSIDNDGVYVRSDESHKLLIQAYENDNLLLIKVTNKKTQTDMFGGLAIVTSYPIEAPYDDATTYSITLTGTGALVDLESTVTVPDAPTLTATAGDGQVALTAVLPENNGGADVTKVKFQAKKASDGDDLWSAPVVQNADDLTYSFSDLTNGLEYSFRAILTNEAGDSAASEVVSATPTAPEP
ncbi:phage major tail protein, TP901-1 family [Sporolactobacillus shoreicorticis]|uniref:phage major tail protein, TP901-1 family n=1 Tax=Sporolactobacillus shoreicorticis TaxID=1923877 RepID=UPI002097F631|nr:phage major tail protein, TP901-1 family [Sporolactobacillus shoreicorticis]MCO7125116.1 phage major tail protein, TP901-1 family [Sporolactobacillus shoreicorticis]